MSRHRIRQGNIFERIPWPRDGFFFWFAVAGYLVTAGWFVWEVFIK